MNCHGVGQQTMDNLNRQTRSTRPKPLFSVMRLSKSKLFWTAMVSSPFWKKEIWDLSRWFFTNGEFHGNLNARQ